MTTFVFQCFNPECGAFWDFDPHGHCPACKREDGSGWSCIARSVNSLPGANQPRIEPRRDIWMDGYWAALNENMHAVDSSEEKHRWRKAAYERHQNKPGISSDRESVG